MVIKKIVEPPSPSLNMSFFNSGAMNRPGKLKNRMGDSSDDTMTGVRPRRQIGVVTNDDNMDEQRQTCKRKPEVFEAEGKNDTIKKKKDDKDGENALPSPPTPIPDSSSSDSDEMSVAIALLGSSTTTVDKEMQKEIEQARWKIKELFEAKKKVGHSLKLVDLLAKGSPLDLKMKLLEHLLYKTSVGVFTVIFSSHFNDQNIDEFFSYKDL